MSSVNPIQPKLEKNPVTPISASTFTLPEHLSKLRSASRGIQQVEAAILEGELKLMRENEDLKAQLQTLSLKYTDLEKKYKKVESEKVEKEIEAKKWKRECEKHKEELTRAKEDLSKKETEWETECSVLCGREKRAVERCNNLIADFEKEIMKKDEELSMLKEKVAQDKEAASLMQKEYEDCESRVKKLEADVAFILSGDPVMAKEAEVMLTAFGSQFDGLIIRKESVVESTVRTGNAPKDVIEIYDSDDSMNATGKRPFLSCPVNNKDIDGNASLQNRKRKKDLSSLKKANDSSDSSDNSITDSYMDKLAFGKSATGTSFGSN